jgi:hypothetical protein
VSVKQLESLTDIFPKVLQLEEAALQVVTLPFMPCLEELKVTVIIKTYGAVACPVEAVAIAGRYVVAAFRLIHAFRLRIEWETSQRSPAGRFLPEETRDAFHRLDALLSDKGLLENLKEVEIDFRPVDVGDGDLENEIAGGLGNKIRSEVLEGLPRTVERVDTVSVTISNHDHK